MDGRCKSPFDVSAALDILGRLSIGEDATWGEYNWPVKETDHAVLGPYDFEEEDADACDPCLYDPALFTPATSHPASPLLGSFSYDSDRDKPLPPPPSTPRLSYSPVTPPSTPSSSPRASISPNSQPKPRSRPPSTSAPRGHTHAAFPSISSTLSLLSERDSETAKRSGVIVTSTGSPRASTDTKTLTHLPLRRSSVDALQALASDGSPPRKRRPNLTLANSTSTPHLRALAELAQTPASPVLSHQPSQASLAASVRSPFESSVNLLPSPSLKPSASRWSIDSNEPKCVERPVLSKLVVESAQTSPAKPRKRDRLMSFISRARAGSLGKQSTSPTRDEFAPATPQDTDFGVLSSKPSMMSLKTSSRRTSHSVYTSQQISATVSTTSTSSTSDASLATPGDSQQDISALDPFGSASPTFSPVSFMPDMSDNADVSIIDDLYESACIDSGSLSAPAPPPPSFLPLKQESLFSTLARKTIRRRKRKVIVTCSPAESDEYSEEDMGQAHMAAARREREQKLREEALLGWCEGFGVVRRFERKENGNVHVYWRECEVAEMVCRLGPQVHVKGVGQVGLAWRYV
ncbi:hypothetical protein BC835DRAFT_1359611, partial [Cytidiella melzeri]